MSTKQNDIFLNYLENEIALSGQNNIKYKGVFKCGKKFKAQIQTHGVQHYLGLFDTAEEAARAYDNHARLTMGEKAKTNFSYDKNANIEEKNDVSNKKREKPKRKIGEENKGPTKRTYMGIKAHKNGINPYFSYPFMSSRMSFPPPGHSVNPSFFDPKNPNFSFFPHMAAGSPYSVPFQFSNAPMFFNSMIQGNEIMSNPYYNPLQMNYLAHANQLNKLRDVRSNEKLESLNSTLENDLFSKKAEKSLKDKDQGFISPKKSRKKKSSSFVEENQIEKDDEPDWRDQIYYWIGKLTFSPKDHRYVWKGTWLGSFTGKPDEEEFELSNNMFEYKSNVKEYLVKDESSPAKSGYYSGFYMMDNDGSGALEKYLDNENFMMFEEDPLNKKSILSVIGRGDSDFGAFILSGAYNTQTKILEIARQYIADNDIRASMNIFELSDCYQQEKKKNKN